MKKLFITISSVLSLLLFTGYAGAQSPSANPSGTPATTDAEKEQKLIDQINNLKEKVASKVAELRLVEKRGIIGIVTEVSGNKITLSDTADQTRLIDVDELTNFSSPSAKGTFGISDISKGTKLSIVGLYNKQSKRILARFVESYIVPSFVTGIVVDVDSANFTMTVLSENKNETIVDIENVTRTSTYTEEDDITRAGFSKIAQGDRVHVIGYPDRREKNRITGTRILIFPDLPKNPKINIPDSIKNEEEEITPTVTGRATQ
jgi:hypothetical protein